MLRLKGERGQDKVFLEAHCVFLVGAIPLGSICRRQGARSFRRESSKESQQVKTSDKTDRVLPSFDPGCRQVFLFHCCCSSEAYWSFREFSSVMTEQACQGPTFFLANACAEKSVYSRRLEFEVVDTRFSETDFFCPSCRNRWLNCAQATC
jgi:hypothetical protein